MVIGDAPQLEKAVIRQQGVGRPRVAVERHPGAAGIDELDSGGRAPRELKVGVPEYDPPLHGSAQQLVVVSGGRPHERAHVGNGRAVAVERPIDCELLGEPLQLADYLLGERLAAGIDRRLNQLVVGSLVAPRRPAVDIAADPGRVG